MPWLAGMKITAQRLIDFTPHTVEYQSLTANATAVTTTETVALTTGSVVFETGRAYRFTIKGLYQSSVAADQVQVRIRKTNTSGTTYVDSFRLYCPAAGGNTAFYLSNIGVNTSGADITAVVVGTYVRSAGTGNVLIAASATNPAYIEVEDIGDASDFSGATAIT
jgi:hypothetical protein